MDEYFGRFAHGVGRNLRGIKRRFDRSIGRTEHPHIAAYRGFGNDARLLLLGRALRDPGLRESGAGDHWSRNLIESYKRMETDELPGARVRARYGSVMHDMTADEEGYFRGTLELAAPPPPNAGYWHTVQLELVEPRVVDGPQPTAGALTLVPPRDADFGIISDLDDTVIQTGATSLLRMLRATLLGNARTRAPFPGVAAFYAALQRGPTGTAFNPVFYVSSSPWNLYDVIEQFLALQRIPMGPTLLRDWGMSLDRLPLGHAAHKTASIRQIMDMYPAMRFILVGDSGQEDPEIYREIARACPGRVLAAYIRDLEPGGAHAQRLGTVAAEFRELGSRMLAAPDTSAAARDALAAGWLAEEALQEIVPEATSRTPHRD